MGGHGNAPKKCSAIETLINLVIGIFKKKFLDIYCL